MCEPREVMGGASSHSRWASPEKRTAKFDCSDSGRVLGSILDHNRLLRQTDRQTEKHAFCISYRTWRFWSRTNKNNTRSKAGLGVSRNFQRKYFWIFSGNHLSCIARFLPSCASLLCQSRNRMRLLSHLLWTQREVRTICAKLHLRPFMMHSSYLATLPDTAVGAAFHLFYALLREVPSTNEIGLLLLWSKQRQPN